jgi:hypothetical protein
MLEGVLSLFQPQILIKIVSIIFVLMISIFMLIVVKQVRDMDQTIILGPSGKLVLLVSYLSVLLTLLLLLTAIVIL